MTDVPAFEHAAREAERAALTGGSLRAMTDQLNGVLARIAEAQEAVYEGTDDSGTVVVRATGAGRVEDVYLSPQAVRDLDAQALGAACVTAVGDARMRAAQALTATIAEVSGQPAPVDVPAPAPRTYDPASAAEALRTAARRAG
ncbi:YbaB/EbfC family nucleoid-associated protein [Micromonospora foliorum]|uniref:YbaB/EbfC family nucleoid-associated protein n=1 Tax=Micromonospora foliorum TaxID=2911210 RepID=UPI001EE9A9B9|nr:YbaB/EbfC family nucleoid-associated protein [Micromonospora foliorum]MCG5438229.1 YbaB/EbfC family nucleoid-associated protein [Micromonospora foliorum]